MAIALGIWIAPFYRVAGATAPAEPCLEKMPPGWSVAKSLVVPTDQTRALGEKLGAPLRRLSNTFLVVHGQTIQVNILHADSDADAATLHAAILGMKPDPAFCVRDGLRVVEFTGASATPALATKVAFELGFRPKPKEIRYRVTAEIVMLEKSDYMRFNELCGLFFRARGEDDAAAPRIRELSETFRYGNALTLRAASSATYVFGTAPTHEEPQLEGEAARYEFQGTPERFGAPYVQVVAEIVTREGGVTPTTRGGSQALTAATPFWPADDPEIRALAKQIVAGKAGREAQVEALLRWLAPGRNIRSGGPVRGSRWGVKRVLEQKFGHCWDSSDCFVTFCRALGIPARQVGGWLYGADGHIWAEVLLEGRGWLQVDPTGGGPLSCGIYHIPYFVTEDGEMRILYASMPTVEIVATD